MFYVLSNEQITAIKRKYFLNIKDDLTSDFYKEYFFDKAYISEAGTDTNFNLRFKTKEIIYSFPEDGNLVTKIFNNDYTSKYIKLKVFQINSPEMLNEIRNIENNRNIYDIFNINEIINKYGCFSVDVNPATDFIKNNEDISSFEYTKYLDETNNNILTLSYDIDISLKEQKMNYLTFCCVFYQDISNFLIENNINTSLVDKTILTNDFLYQNIIFNGQPVQTDDSSIIDLRLSKAIFDNNQLLNNIQNQINIDNTFTKILSNNKINNDISSFFSNVYFSKNTTNKRYTPKNNLLISRFTSPPTGDYLSFLFNVDLNNIIYNFSSYKSIINNTTLVNEIKKHINPKSIRILRRQVDKNSIKGVLRTNNDTSTAIIETSFDQNANLLDIDNANNLSTIKNGLLTTNFFNDIKTIEVTDKALYGNKYSGVYQYGVEITIEDKFADYLKSFIKINNNIVTDNYLPKRLNDLKEYHILTFSQTKYIKDSNGKEKKVIGNYDPITNSFSQEFINTFDKEYKTKINNAIYVFIATLDMFGLLTSIVSENSKQISNLLIDLKNKNINYRAGGQNYTPIYTILFYLFSSMVYPNYGTPESILQFINLYEKVINQISRTLNTYRSKTYKIEHWFTNDYVEANSETALGYKYLPIDLQSGLGFITTADFNSILLENYNNYVRQGTQEAKTIENNDNRFMCPRIIFAPQQDIVINITDLISNPLKYQSFDFTELELDIKRYNLTKEQDKKLSIKSSNNQIFDREQELKYRTDDAFRRLSIKIDNLFLNDKSDEEIIKENGSINSLIVPNKRVDPTFLMLGISKQIDFSNNKLKKKKRIEHGEVNFNRFKVAIENFRTLNITNNNDNKYNVPLQVEALTKNCSRFFNNLPTVEDEKYLKNLTSNSQFLILYNAIQEIEYLEYDSNSTILKNEKWRPYTKAAFRRSEVQNILCRIKTYSNSDLNIDYFDDIKLPIYNQYFIISRSNYTSISVPPAVVNTYGGLYENLIGLLERKILLNSLPTNVNFKLPFNKQRGFASPLLNKLKTNNILTQSPINETINISKNTFSKTQTLRVINDEAVDATKINTDNVKSFADIIRKFNNSKKG